MFLFVTSVIPVNCTFLMLSLPFQFLTSNILCVIIFNLFVSSSPYGNYFQVLFLTLFYFFTMSFMYSSACKVSFNATIQCLVSLNSSTISLNFLSYSATGHLSSSYIFKEAICFHPVEDTK